MYRRLSLFVLTLVLANCAAPQALPVPTSTPLPTPTIAPSPTPIALADIDLESILVLPGDLPASFLSGQIKSSIPSEMRRFDELPVAEQVIYTDFREGQFKSDGIFIMLYNNQEDTELAYDLIVSSHNPESKLDDVDNLGERASLATRTLSGIYFSKAAEVIYTRCRALVYIGLFSPLADDETTITYAKRIEKRLSSLVCD